MIEEHGFNESENELIKVFKKTLKIMAKVIKDRDPGEVIKDIDPNVEIEDKFIAKVIIEKNFLMKIGNIDPASENEDDNLASLVDELINAIKEVDSSREVEDQDIADIIKNLARLMHDTIIPDMPGLNPKEEGAMGGQLGPSIFVYLMTRQKSQGTEKYL